MTRVRRGPRSEAARTLLRHAGLAAVAVVAVAGAAAGVCVHVVRTHALREAEGDGESVALGTLAPLIDPGVYDGDAGALTAIDDRVRVRKSGGTLTRVDVWSAAGVVLYSDDPGLIGRHEPLDAAGHTALTDGDVRSRVSGLPGLEPSLEVYTGTTDTEGRPIVVETAYTSDRLRRDENDLVLRLLPALAGALLAFALLWLVAPPTSGRFRRLFRYEREQHAMIHLAVEAAAAERRRVAGELHDGVIQDLAGVRLTLDRLDAQITGLTGSAPPSVPQLRSTLHSAMRLVHDDLLALRELTGTRWSADSGAADPVPALAVVADELRSKGARIDTDLRPLPALPPAHRAALIRVGREALRNAAQHAPSATATLALYAEGPVIVLTVTDDGPGFDVDSAPGPVEGRIGLVLLAEAARTMDGRLELRSRPGRGTTVRLVVPVPSVP